MSPFPIFFSNKRNVSSNEISLLTGGKREKRERGERERKERERVFWVFWFLLLFFFYFSSFFRLFYIQEEMASFFPLLTGVGRERGFGEVERVVEEGRGQREREDEKRRQRFSSPSSTSS